MISKLIEKYKWKLVSSLVFSASSAFVSVGMIAFANYNLNNYSSHSAYFNAFAFLLSIAGMFLIGFTAKNYLVKVSSTMLFEMRTVIVKRILNTDYSRKINIGRHKIYATITNDVGNLANMLSLLPVFAFNMLVVVLCFVYFIFLSLEGFIILFSIIGISLLALKTVMSRGMEIIKDLRENTDEVFGMYKALVDGTKEMTLDSNRKNYFYDKQLEPKLLDIRNKEITASSYWNFSQSFSTSMLFVAIGAIIFISHFIDSIDQQALSGYIIGVVYLVGPLSVVMNSFQSLSHGLVSYRKINSFELSDEDDSVGEGVQLPEQWHKISVEELYYKYESENDDYAFSVGPLSLEIKQGRVIFICGGNGSGKSSLASLITGLVQPNSGVIKIDGVDINNNNLCAYRAKFNAIFSDFYLFDHVLDKHGQRASDEITTKHLKSLGLHHKVDVENGILSTTELSQGQKKRLALMMSFVSDADIYMFDEWAADQDPQFRNHFYNHILPELKGSGKTVLVISHDEKYFGTADDVIHMDSGMICDGQSMSKS